MEIGRSFLDDFLQAFVIQIPHKKILPSLALQALSKLHLREFGWKENPPLLLPRPFFSAEESFTVRRRLLISQASFAPLAGERRRKESTTLHQGKTRPGGFASHSSEGRPSLTRLTPADGRRGKRTRRRRSTGKKKNDTFGDE